MSGLMSLALALLAGFVLSAVGIMLDPARHRRTRWVLMIGGTAIFGIALLID